MSSAISRGALIVLEGVDKSGKSTQCRKLVENLISKGIKSELWRYPERSTAIGKVINDYLEKKIELDDHAVHLLFSANRWESVPKMKEKLMGGVTLVVDRYAFSGVAFTAAKEGFDMDWCKTPDVGLPAPDLVIYLTLNPMLASTRGDYGEERYEKTDFQIKVQTNFDRLREDSWKLLEATRSIEEIEKDLLELACETAKSCQSAEIGQLWVLTKGKRTLCEGKENEAER